MKKNLTDKEKIYFRGFLTNADASILRLSLDHGFKIEALSENEFWDFIAAADNIPHAETVRFLFEFPCLNYKERKVYVVNNSFETSVKTREGLSGNAARFDNKFVLGYLNPVFRLMRLFKEGDIRMPVKYYYYIKNGKPKGRIKLTSHRYISLEPYHLESSELADLLRFVHNIKLPFKESFLQLAFENFELSYEIFNIGLSFLALMISLETLLNPGRHELRHRISRNAAVLLGKDKEDSRKIFSEVKELYDKRSEVVHTGESGIIEKKVLLKLRYYVRESIKKIHMMGKSKNQILELLNSQGFGEG